MTQEGVKIEKEKGGKNPHILSFKPCSDIVTTKNLKRLENLPSTM